MMNIAGSCVTLPWGKAEEEHAPVGTVEFVSSSNVFPKNVESKLALADIP
jgi:hypothetical protein